MRMITVENASKRYPLRFKQNVTLRHEAKTLLKQLFNPEQVRRPEKLYALKDVSFTIDQGESVAIVGRNGSGKTTMLRLLAGISHPTEGHVSVRGRFSALIGLGTGFHPHLTGRENIYLSSAIHGRTPEQVEEIIDDIIEFADIGPFIDAPIKTYSSGMRSRLGFSLAINVEPEMMFLDEILGVGDIGFQDKCYWLINEFRKENGTIVFVSHAPEDVYRICERCIWLDRGQLIMDGPVEVVMPQYIDYIHKGGVPEPQGKVG